MNTRGQTLVRMGKKYIWDAVKYAQPVVLVEIAAFHAPTIALSLQVVLVMDSFGS
jgi:hypothetical protein